MNMHSDKKTPEQMVEAIFALDLDPIKFKLMDAKEGQGWTRAEADRQELEYKRFLALVAKFPEEAIVPNTDVDKFWHAHILDTMKYAEDCQNVFGYFLHHFPYFGMRDEEDAANLANAASKTQTLYMQEFGASKPQDAAYCGAAATSYCGVASDKTAAYCGVASDKNAAYCGAASEKKAAAYCGAAAGKGASAYCGIASDKTAAAYCGAANASYCGVVAGKGRPSLEKSAAYCGVASEPTRTAHTAEAAYCGKAGASYCGVAAGGEAAKEAYCGAANTSYCGVVTGKGRPALDKAAA